MFQAEDIVPMKPAVHCFQHVIIVLKYGLLWRPMFCHGRHVVVYIFSKLDIIVLGDITFD